MILGIFKDMRVKRLKAMWKREREKYELFEREYIKERDRRIELESLLFNDIEKEYLRQLLLQEEVLHSHKHTSFGLYSELDVDFLDFLTELRIKLNKTDKGE
ncbi:hypothetical protein [Metabacillus sp. Hm71]|uniref:hypothetical protein n=1 Tax=Metabacillus sp. Hm71 TaxID=3450743 RepID=UPI003F43D39F